MNRATVITIKRTNKSKLWGVANLIDNTNYPFSVKTTPESIVISVHNGVKKSVTIEDDNNLLANLKKIIYGEEI